MNFSMFVSVFLLHVTLVHGTEYVLDDTDIPFESAFSWTIRGFKYVKRGQELQRLGLPLYNIREGLEEANGIWWISSLNESSPTQRATILFLTGAGAVSYVKVRFCLIGLSTLSISSGHYNEPFDTVGTHQEAKYVWLNYEWTLARPSKFSIDVEASHPEDAVLIDRVVVSMPQYTSHRRRSNSRKRRPSGKGNSIRKTPRLISAGINDERRLWPGGNIPFRIMSSFNNTTALDIRIAMEFLESYTNNCVRFIPMSPAQIVLNEPYHLRFWSSTSRGCSADMGYVNTVWGFQNVTLGPHCSTGTIVHELMHVLGCDHEQRRKYRGKYIRINRTNIIDGFGFEYTRDTENKTVYKMPYNFESLMHYSPYGKHGSTVITTKNYTAKYPAFGDARKMGQRDHITWPDFDLIIAMYNKSCPVITRVTGQGAGAGKNEIIRFPIPGARPNDTSDLKFEDYKPNIN